jgi:hypothetical protein
MKRISFFLALVLTLCAFGTANAVNEVTLGQVLQNGTPITNDTVLLGPSGSTVQFNLNVTTDVLIGGTTCGFYVYTTGALDFSGINADKLPAWAALEFGLVNQTPEYNPDGSPDTVAFEFAKFTTGGAPAGYDAPSWLVSVQMPAVTDNSFDGEEICIDSVPLYGPGNLNWIWNDGDGNEINPPFGGPYCLTLYFLPNQPPQLVTCPPSPSGSHCGTLTATVVAQDPEGDPFTYQLLAGPGSVDPNTGVWTWNPTLADVGVVQTVQIAGNDGQVGQVCEFNPAATNLAPAITNCPTNVISAQVGVERTVDLNATDNCPGDPLMWSFTGTTAGTVAIDAMGVLTYTPDATEDGMQVCFEVTASDGVDGSTCEVCFDVSAGAPFIIRIEKDEGQTGVGALQGQYTNVDVSIEASATALGGFNFLFAYDNSVLSFSAVDLTGSVLYDGCEWEYMTFRTGADGNCSGGCPSGLIRVVGIAEQNDGPNHPVAGCNPTGVMFGLTFLVSNDRTVGCQYAPVRFFWLECGDNTITNEAGDTLFISQSVQDYQSFDPQDPYGDDLGPALGFPTYAGHPDACETSDKTDVIRAIGFQNGGVDIVCPNEIDDRGDINLDGLGYTIADAVMFTRYFIFGMNALPANTVANPFAREAAIAASDVNNDGLTLTVADLVYLIRVVVGDAVPYPKTTPITANYDVSADGQITVEGAMGAAYIVVNEQVNPTLIATNMEIMSEFREGQMHILVYSTEAGQSFEGSFIDLGSNDIAYIEMATYDGTPVTSLVGDLVPDNFALAQNYPNPFNPATTVEFSLPVRSDYSLKIYNVTGQLVKEFVGTENAGTHQIVWDATSNASGIYFYKVTAGNFTDTKKMVLLK